MPRGCAFSKVCMTGKSGCVVSYTLMLLEPDAESSCVLVGATAKTSLAFGCAESTVCNVRYCFDWAVSMDICGQICEHVYHCEYTQASHLCSVRPARVLYRNMWSSES